MSRLLGIAFVMLLIGTGSAWAQPVDETAITPGGLRAAFPAEFSAEIPPDTAFTLRLTRLEEAGFVDIAIRAGDETSRRGSPQGMVDAFARGIEAAQGEVPPDSALRVPLQNGSAIALPYRIAGQIDSGLYIAARIDGRPVELDLIAIGETTLLAEPELWLSLLSSIRFSDPGETPAVELPQIAVPPGPLELAEMPLGQIVFADDLALTLTEGWAPREAYGPISDRVTLALNGAEALAIITTVDVAGYGSFADWRNALISLSGGLLTANAAGALPEPTLFALEGGRTLERYASEDLTFLSFFIDLGGGWAASALIVMLTNEEPRRIEIAQAATDLMTTMTRFIRVPPQG